jgi:peptide/nickel transport system permease protein
LTGYIVRRLIQTVVVIVLVSFVSFLLIQLMPGDPAASMLGPNATKAQVDALRLELGLDKPMMVQYFDWLNKIVHADLGTSLSLREPVSSLFAQRLQITFYLSLISFILSTLLGVALGIICAIRRGGFLDQFLSMSANIGIAIPIFWLGILGLYVFGMKAQIVPIYGWVSPFSNFTKSISYTILPVILLAVPGIAVMTRQTRSSMLEVTQQDYIRTAYSKGLKERNVVIKHAVKNALIPIVTLLGLQLRVLVGGSVLVEQVFSIPGMGRLLVSASQNKDFIVVQDGVLLIGVIVCLANLLVDISYGWLDPRMRYD